ncbi:MAG: transglycosylase SLT domain-containing protein [Bryobacterales bacterium]|nr:transglycosylase SLT domain-containing protein [Bryobacterales bacterium]
MTHRNSVRNTLALCASLTLLVPEGWGQGRGADFPPQALSRGLEQMREKSFRAAVATFQGALPRMPQLADYPYYFQGLAYSELKDSAKAAGAFSAVVRFQPVSPFAARAAVSAAKAYVELGRAKDALALLKQSYKNIPQSTAEAALAGVYEALGDPISAAASWQKVYYGYPAAESAGEAGLALVRLKASLGEKFPPVLAQALLGRANALANARRYAEAKQQLEQSLSSLAGDDRDLARVRMGVMDYKGRQMLASYKYLRGLEVNSPEADAERLYHLTYLAKRLDRESDMRAHLAEVERKYPNSKWRLESILTTAYLYHGRGEQETYEGLYKTCAASFSAQPDGSFCDWKITWGNYQRRPADAETLFRAHIKRYPNSEKVPASFYFLARQAELRRDYGMAKAYYQHLADYAPNHYYAMLAEERLETALLAKATASLEVGDFLAGLELPVRRIKLSFEPTRATVARLERARLLSAAGLGELAEGELRFAARNDGQPQVIAMELAKLLDSRGAHDEALRAVKAYVPGYLNIPFEDAPVNFWRVAFPLPYRDALERYSRQKDLDPYIVAGLIRQESEFNPKAISVAKAYGLTQVLPSTGRWLSRKNGIRGFTTAKLFEPEMNLRLGTIYLRQLLDSFKTRWEHVLAAYNGGPTRVNRWLNWGTYREPSEFIETIPIAETRDYVQIVLRNAGVYRRLYGQSSAGLPAGKGMQGNASRERAGN